jgi:hypothetical protein
MMVKNSPHKFNHHHFEMMSSIDNSRNEMSMGSTTASLGMDVDASKCYQKRRKSEITSVTVKKSKTTERAVAQNDLASLQLPFPWKLYQLLEDSEMNGTQHIVSWLPEGDAFAVHKPEDFSKRIMSSYFRLDTYQSFTRELQRYGFNNVDSIRVPCEEDAFFHPRYLRKDKSNCLSLRRKATFKAPTKKRMSSPLKTKPSPTSDGSLSPLKRQASSWQGVLNRLTDGGLEHKQELDHSRSNFSIMRVPQTTNDMMDDLLLRFNTSDEAILSNYADIVDELESHHIADDRSTESAPASLGSSCSRDWFSNLEQLYERNQPTAAVHVLEPRSIEEMILLGHT